MLKLAEITPSLAAVAGGKAHHCAQMRQAGLPVPDGFVVLADEACREGVSLSDALKSFPSDTLFAVRSSSVDEDGAQASSAGVFQSVLNVPAGSVGQAIEDVRSAAQSSDAAHYRATVGLSAAPGPLAVLVQQMVAAKVSGVAFTKALPPAAPTEMVIAATEGLGDNLLDGREQGVEFRLRRSDGSVVASDLTMGEAPAPALLHGAQLRVLHALLLRVEAFFGAPQDVEWCYDGERFWLVQSRPITAIGDGMLWTRDNLAEILPEMTSPLLLDGLEQYLNQAGDEICRDLGLAVPPGLLMAKTFMGRLYVNDSFYRRVLQGNTAPGLPRVLYALKALWRVVRWLRSGQARVESMLLEAREGSQARSAMLQQRSPSEVPAKQMLETLLTAPEADAFEVRLQGRLGIELSMGAAALLGRLIGTNAAAGRTAGQLSSSNISANLGLDLIALARQAAEEAGVKSYFLTTSTYADYRTALAQTAFLDAFDGYLGKYGHRGLFERDASMPRYAEDPTPLLQAVASHVRHGASAQVAPKNDEQLGLSQNGRTKGTVLSPLLRPLYEKALSRARRLEDLRELNHSVQVAEFAEARRWWLVLGQKLVAQDYLDQADDIFLLRVSELKAAVDQQGFGALCRGIIQTRRMRQQYLAGITVPTRFRGGDPSAWSQTSAAVETTGPNLDVLKGRCVFPGAIRGIVTVLSGPQDIQQMWPGSILVVPAADHSWIPLLTLASGVIFETGTVLSHISTVAREFGLPSLTNVPGATKRLATGDTVLLDATNGIVSLLKASEQRSVLDPSSPAPQT